MRKKGRPDSEEYIVFRVYIHRTLDKEICNIIASMPYPLRGLLVKEALRSHVQNKGKSSKPEATRMPVTENKGVMDRISKTFEHLDWCQVVS